MCFQTEKAVKLRPASKTANDVIVMINNCLMHDPSHEYYMCIYCQNVFIQKQDASVPIFNILSIMDEFGADEGNAQKDAFAEFIAQRDLIPKLCHECRQHKHEM